MATVFAVQSLGPVFVDGIAIGCGRCKHQTITDVGVMRNREVFMPHRALNFLVSPQIFTLDGIERREDRVRPLVVAEEYVAVHVAAVGNRSPLIGNQRGEFAGVVVLVSGLDISRPVFLEHVGFDVFRHRDTGQD